ncbi:MAG TPA: aminoacyl-tRNA hydrolase [Tepidisphaeraceae bacterium]|jgi:PTH1 family peptidyl-tRNA hydrolase|nr:aminoacyl-tRNA hydrolase [Tepidisphaeraceae bacterium]
MTKLVVGLGNPGREYAGTRHNIGFDVIDRLADRLGLTSKPGDFDRLAKAKFDGLTMDGAMALGGGGSEKVLLLKPLTYMNLSGRSVNAAMAFYQLSVKEIIVVLDDLALPCGKIRLRAGGSSGGHNGLKDIEQVLASNAYPRLRLGIDAPPGRVPGRDYVLGRFSEDQRAAIEPAIDRSVSAIQTWIESGIESAMNRFNGEENK